MKTIRAALACLPFLVACGGDDGGDAEQYAGTWLITSMTIPSEGGAVTVTRDGSPQSLRGDAVFTPTGAAAASLHVRQMPLVDGVPITDVMSQDMAIAIEGDRWVLTGEEGDVTVFTAMLHEGEHLMLTLDASDPRTTAENPPEEVQLMRATPWTTASVGAWDLLRMTSAGGTMMANQCIEVVPGERWAKLQMMVAFDEHLVFSRTMTTAGYSDLACTELVSMEQSRQTGLAEEEGGNLLRLWAYEHGVGEHLTFSMASEDHVMTLTRTACLPMPGCDGEAPTSVVVIGR